MIPGYVVYIDDDSFEPYITIFGESVPVLLILEGQTVLGDRKFFKVINTEYSEKTVIEIMRIIKTL